MFNALSKEAQRAMEILHSKGFEAYAVGGCVRDMLMHKTPMDYDITTSALPEETKSALSSFRTIDTGIAHGTVTVLIDGIPLEITTYRTETGYSDKRHPDKIEFTESLRKDLSRRDFTMNSIAYCEKEGCVDPFGGIEDINNRLIRCVGAAEERFREDALRILRALRFSSELGFSIEEETKKALFTCRELLKEISPERVFAEISRLLCGENVRNVLSEYSQVLEVVLPEIKEMRGFEQKNPHHIHDVLTHTAIVTESIPPLLQLRLAALFHDCGKPFCFSTDEKGIGHFYSHACISAEMAQRALERLRCDSKTKERVVKLIKLHDAPIEESEGMVKRKLRSLGEDMFFDLIELQRADTKGLAPQYFKREKHFDALCGIAEKIIRENQCFSLRELAIDGNDLIREGYKGREIGNMLRLCLEAVIDSKAENEKDTLLNYCRSKAHK